MDQAKVDAASAAVVGGIFFVIFLMFAIMVIPAIIGMWKVFSKAGKPGWAAIVPIYNMVVLMEIIGRPVLWVILTFVPGVNAIIMILASIDLAKSFGRGAGMGIGLAFVPTIFYPVLGFGSAEYEGPAA